MPERVRRSPLVDVALLVVLLLLQGSVLGLDHGTFTSDEGAYALQAIQLADTGAWPVADPFLADSPAGPLTSFVNATVNGDGEVFAYAQRPLWPVVLSFAYDVGGETGLYAVPFLFAVLVPVVAWRLASVLVRRGQRVAFWVAAVSPAVVANGHVLWAHSASALVAGLAVLGVVERRRRPNGLPAALATAGAVVAVVVGVLLRAEGFLFAGAVAGGLLLTAALTRSARDLWLAIVVGAAGIVGFGLGSAWRDSVTGSSDQLASRNGGGSRVGDILTGGFHDLIGDQARSGRTGIALLAVCACLTVLLGVRVRRGLADAPVFAVAVLATLTLAWVVSPGGTVTGVAAAWPIGVAGLLALRLADRVEQRLLLVTAGLFTAAVLVTNYGEGGGLEWGGRFLSPLTVLGAVGAAAGWHALVADHFEATVGERVLVGAGGPAIVDAPLPAARRTSRHVAAVLIATAVVIAGFATTAMRDTRGPSAEYEAAIAAADIPVTLTTNAFLPNILWRTREVTDWIIVGEPAAGGRSVVDAVAAMADAGVTRFGSLGVPVEELEAAGADVEGSTGALVVATLG